MTSSQKLAIIDRVDRHHIESRLKGFSSPDVGVDTPDARLLTPAAVLVPLRECDDGLKVVLTRRTEHLRDHAGQISFPGGRIERHDASPQQAALREAEEEIGLGAAQVELIGRLARFKTGTGFLVHPFVGFIDPRAVLRPEPFEVAEIFEVPLSFILNPGNHRPHSFRHRGRQYDLVAMPFDDYFIWGATAGMLHQLYQVLSE